MKQLFCVIVLMTCFAITVATPINAAGDKFTIRIKSEIESLSGIYLSGRSAAFNSAKNKAQTNDLKNKPDQKKGISDESKILGTYSYTDEMGSGYSITLDKGGVGTEDSYRVNWKIKWSLNGDKLTVIGQGTTTIYTVKGNQLISEDCTVYTKK